MIRSLLSRATGRLAPALALCALGALVPLAVPSLASAEACPNAALRTGPSAHLPDCRAYELVTPPYKNDGNIGPALVTPEGLAGPTVVFDSVSGFAGIESNNGNTAEYKLGRTEGGWNTTPLNLAASVFTGEFVGQSGDFFGLSENAGTSVWAEREVGESARAIDLFSRGPEGSVVDVGPALPPSAPAATPRELGELTHLSPAGVSADGSRALFSVRASFWPSDSTQVGRHSLYEYVGKCAARAVECEARKAKGEAPREPLLVGVSDGKTIVNGAALPAGQSISECGTELGAGEPGTGDSGIVRSHNAMSSDGKTVFFTAYPASICSSPPAVAPAVAELFARVETTPGTYETAPISEPIAADCASCDTSKGVLKDAEFQGASTDGSKVFFTTKQPLLGGDTSENVYEYDLDAPAGERLVRASGGDSTVSNPVANVQGVPVQISEDGSHVYFVAQGVLTTASNTQGATAVAGADNLYVYERDSHYPQGRTAFIADLCTGVGISGGEISGPAVSGGVLDGRCPSGLNRLDANDGENRNDLRLWSSNAQSQGGADVTPDGRFLVFTSYGDLTPDDFSGARQVFEYDALEEKLVRVSIGQAGFNDNGNTAVDDAEIAFPSYERGRAYEADGYWSKLTVSQDGAYVFFQSTDALTKEALNHAQIGEEGSTPYYANNIYEYHDGTVSLISDGHDVAFAKGSVVTLFGADASGKDVFFRTTDALVGQDTDEQEDIYDARIGGGFPAPPVPRACSGEACQGGLSGAPTLLSPGSEFQAGGNPPLASGKPAVKPKALTRAQKLANALRACRKKSYKKRAACEAQARKRYKAKGSAHRAGASGKGGRS